MQDEQRNERQFDLLRFLQNSFRLLRRTWWIVVVAAVLGALLTGIYVRQTYTPRYESHAVLSVHSSNNTVTDILGGNEKTDANITKQIISTFPTIIRSDAMRDRIMRETGSTTINGVVTPAVIADSNLFTLTVSSSDPQDAYDIIRAVIKSYPEMAFIFIGAARIEIIEEPTVPTKPIKELNVVRPAILGGLLAGLLVLAILCLLGQMQTTVNSSADLQRYTNVPCIVHIPQTVLKRRSRSSNQLSLLNSHLPASFEESIRALRSRLLRQIREQDLHKIIITSTVPGEGKSTIAANLALSFSHSNLRVVLIDADLRTQELREFFGIEEEARGLADLLQDHKIDPIKCLIPVPDTNVQLLCGSTLDRPVTLLRRNRLSRILDRLQQVADLVLIDTPPIGLLTDAAAFAQYADGAVYVVRPGISSGSRIADGMQAVADCKTRLLGYVLNGVSARSGSHGYGYRYSYGYGYGSYGSNYAAGYSSTYRRGGSGYGSYGGYSGYSGYSSYGGYGGYADYAAAASASQQQRDTEKSSRRRSRRHSEDSDTSQKKRGSRGRKHQTPAPESDQLVMDAVEPAEAPIAPVEVPVETPELPVETVEAPVELPPEAAAESLPEMIGTVPEISEVPEAPAEGSEHLSEEIVEAIEATAKKADSAPRKKSGGGKKSSASKKGSGKKSGSGKGSAKTPPEQSE